jgi:hypothetical protein
MAHRPRLIAWNAGGSANLHATVTAAAAATAQAHLTHAGLAVSKSPAPGRAWRRGRCTRITRNKYQDTSRVRNIAIWTALLAIHRGHVIGADA